MDPFLALTPDDEYYGHWLDLRRRRNRARFLFVMALLSCVLISLLVEFLFRVPRLFQGLVFLGVWAVHLLAVGWPLTYRFRFPCPRCRRPFYVQNSWAPRPWDRWPWPTRCVHCKLREYAANEDD